MKAMREVQAFALSPRVKICGHSILRLPQEMSSRHLRVLLITKWRTWAACFIQAAWRRYSKRKKMEHFQRKENGTFSKEEADHV
ncbi:hypothetical protein Pint_06083 [Pistacia integerrima]|uniref:Uncharacterized protein n=1 Tax=Pistacia integerrima TaxID=434235 RepID=A0ACC0Z907_9ROSI|nr:hypothetical protein Pint_06083 [Pistacia integerrima]